MAVKPHEGESPCGSPFLVGQTKLGITRKGMEQNLFMRKTFVNSIIIVFVLVSLTGCAKLRKTPSLAEPPEPSFFKDVYTIDQFHADLSSYVDANSKKDMASANLFKKKILVNLRWMVNLDYKEYEGAILSWRAKGRVFSDSVQTAAGTIAVISGGQRFRDVLSAAILGFQGVDRSLKANLFNDLSPETFAGAMDQARQPALDKLQACIQADADTCSFEEGRDILTDLFFKGTYPEAKKFIAQQAVGAKVQATPK